LCGEKMTKLYSSETRNQRNLFQGYKISPMPDVPTEEKEDLTGGWKIDPSIMAVHDNHVNIISQVKKQTVVTFTGTLSASTRNSQQQKI
jgi:hypothetical protein